MKWFNIGGPCNPAKNYMLSATERLPKVMSLINKEQYFVVHAPRQCGKTTKSHEKAYDQICGYMDTLGVDEGWLVVFDSDLTKPWDEKISASDLAWQGKDIHIVCC